MRRSIHGGDVEDLELAGLAELLSKLFSGSLQPVTIVRAQSARRVLKTGIDHLQIEHGKTRRLGRT